MVVKAVWTPKPKRITDMAPKEDVDQVKQAADHMNVIDSVQKTASRLSGADRLMQENEQIRNERDEARKEAETSKFDAMKAELKSQIDQVSQGLRQGASNQDLAKQLSDVVSVAERMGMKQEQRGDLKDMITMVKEFRGPSFEEQLKSYAQVMQLLSGNGKKEEKPQQSQGVSDQVAVQLKQLDTNLQLQLQKMQDERQEREHRFQFEMERFKAEREERQNELNARIGAEQERNKMFGQGFQQIGRAIVKAANEGAVSVQRAPQGNRVQGRQDQRQAAGQGQQQVPVIEAGEGEAGEVQCPTCGQGTVPVAEDASRASCLECGQRFSIRRVGAAEENPGAEDYEESEQGSRDEVLFGGRRDEAENY